VERDGSVAQVGLHNFISYSISVRVSGLLDIRRYENEQRTENGLSDNSSLFNGFIWNMAGNYFYKLPLMDDECEFSYWGSYRLYPILGRKHDNAQEV
jgi:hypothetical protein